MNETIDVMVLAPHPDDAELACGGVIAQLSAAGTRVAIVDMTRGESGTRGTTAIRACESAAAAAVLGVAERLNLELPDARLRNDETAAAKIVETIRRLRPGLLLAPANADLHPDHAVTGALARRTFFLAGLAAWEPSLGPPHRPDHLLRYPLHDAVPASLCVDISAVADTKLAALRCHASQLGSGPHLARLDPLQRAQARDRYFGAMIGCSAAEPYTTDGPLRLRDLACLL